MVKILLLIFLIVIITHQQPLRVFSETMLLRYAFNCWDVEMISAPFLHLHQHWINILIKLWENSLELDNSLRVNTTDEDDGVEHDQSGLPHHLQQQWGLSLVEQTPGSSGYRFYENFRWTFLTWIMYVKEAQVLKASASFFIKIFIYINILLTCFQRIVYF